MTEQVFTEYARAKVNLTLHVSRVIKDPLDPFFGYHPLDSLVVFADLGDRIDAVPAKTTTLDISGPQGAALAAEPHNLILRAHDAVARETSVPSFRFSLTKTLPVAAGLGGGSANAAAVLRLLRRQVRLPQATWNKIALGLGADVPVCLASVTARMTGIGEGVTPAPGIKPLHGLLVNPGLSVSTAAIFKAFDGSDSRQSQNDTPRPHHLRSDGDMPDIWDQIVAGRNDLQAVAIDLVPEIADVLAAISGQVGCQLARMSGSGASCYGVFATAQAAWAAAQAIEASHPHWWCRQTVFAGDSMPARSEAT